MNAGPDPGLRVRGKRLLASLAALAEVGKTEQGGAERLAFSPEDGRGRDLVRSWMEEAGLEIRVDGIGNVIGRRPGESPGLDPILLGSHIDTVGNGGRYDGNLGVLAALEVVRTLDDAGARTKRPLEIGFFSNEEGSRYHPDMMGSLVYAGGLSVEDACSLRRRADDGEEFVLGEELAAIGYRGEAPLPGPVPAAYLELHIEQGPLLEAEGIELGAVTGVQGILWEEVTIRGASNHAGTTPMPFRRDSGVVAAEAVLAARRLTGEIPGQVATVGRASFRPGLTNVVPGEAVFTVDLRNPSPDRLERAEREFFSALETAAERERVEFERRELARFGPAAFDERIVSLVEDAAAALGKSCRRLPSGAGHDAQMMSRICPAGMIFTPSVKGISHSPYEFTDDASVVAGANALLLSALRLLDGGIAGPAGADRQPVE